MCVFAGDVGQRKGVGGGGCHAKSDPLSRLGGGWCGRALRPVSLERSVMLKSEMEPLMRFETGAGRDRGAVVASGWGWGSECSPEISLHRQSNSRPIRRSTAALAAAGAVIGNGKTERERQEERRSSPVRLLKTEWQLEELRVETSLEDFLHRPHAPQRRGLIGAARPVLHCACLLSRVFSGVEDQDQRQV